LFGLPFTVREVQPTPNPNAAKFLLDRPISESPTSFFNALSAQGHPVASRLFAIAGVSSILLLGDFVTVNKNPDAKWSEITSKVKRVLSSI
jgi:NFU1 iron-sulfur cluster scaffold homolog, mitochondrial